MFRKNVKIVLAGILAAMMTVTGCGASEASGSSAASTEYGAQSEDVTAAQEIAEDTGLEDAVSEGADSEEIDSDEIDSEGADSEEADSGDDSALRQAENNEKIVYTGDMEIQTLSYDDAADGIRARIKEAGGFIESESEYDSSYDWYDQDIPYDNEADSMDSGKRRTLYITARIPSDQFESFMNSLEGEGRIVSRSVNAENVSQVYSDKQATKEALEKEEQRLLEMMDKAESVEDMISVETRLSEVEQQLNRYKTDLSSMDRDIEYSTVNISLDEVKRYSGTDGGVSFAQRIRYAAADGVNGFISFCRNTVVFTVRYFPFLIIALIVIFLLVRRRRKRRARRKEDSTI